MLKLVLSLSIVIWAQGSAVDLAKYAQARQKTGTAYFEAGKLKAAARPLEEACFAGLAAACSLRGQMGSRGPEADPTDPAFFLRMACERADPESCLAAAKLHQDLDADLARTLYNQACQYGAAAGCTAAAKLESRHTSPLLVNQLWAVREAQWCSRVFKQMLGTELPLGACKTSTPDSRFRCYLDNYQQAVQTKRIQTDTGVTLATLYIKTRMSHDYPAATGTEYELNLTELWIFSGEKLLETSDRLPSNPLIKLVRKRVLAGFVRQATETTNESLKSPRMPNLKARLEKLKQYLASS